MGGHQEALEDLRRNFTCRSSYTRVATSYLGPDLNSTENRSTGSQRKVQRRALWSQRNVQRRALWSQRKVQCRALLSQRKVQCRALWFLHNTIKRHEVWGNSQVPVAISTGWIRMDRVHRCVRMDRKRRCRISWYHWRKCLRRTDVLHLLSELSSGKWRMLTFCPRSIVSQFIQDVPDREVPPARYSNPIKFNLDWKIVFLTIWCVHKLN